MGQMIDRYSLPGFRKDRSHRTNSQALHCIPTQNATAADSQLEQTLTMRANFGSAPGNGSHICWPVLNSVQPCHVHTPSEGRTACSTL